MACQRARSSGSPTSTRYFLLALPVGAALDRRPLPVLAAGALLTAAAGLTRAVSESYEAALAGQLLGAFAQPVLYNGIVVVARASLPEEQRATGIAVGTVGSFVGLILGLVLPPLLADGTDLSTLLWVEGGAALLFGLVQLATLRMPLRAHGRRAGAAGAAEVARRSGGASARARFVRRVRHLRHAADGARTAARTSRDRDRHDRPDHRRDDARRHPRLARRAAARRPAPDGAGGC